MFKRAALTCSFLLCASAFGADEPAWLTKERAREARSQLPTEIRSKDGWFKARTPGKLVNAIDKVGGSYSVQLEVGGDTTMRCEVFPEGMDLANGLRTKLESALASIEAQHGKIQSRELETSDAGAYGAVPYIQLSWLYRVEGPKGLLLGNLKQFVMEKGNVAVYCAHDDLGYARTFATITRTFAESFETRKPAVVPHFTEISAASMSGTKFGVTLTTLERGSEGVFKARKTTALLIATHNGHVRSQDSTHINWLRADGSLIHAANTEISNGELSNKLSLKEQEDGAWVVEGEIQGKAVKTHLPGDSKPGNWVAQSRELRALLSEPDAVGREHRMGIWISENPAKLTPARTRVLARRDDTHFTARLEFGSINATLTLDKTTGTASATDVKIGPVNMRIERVYAEGAL